MKLVALLLLVGQAQNPTVPAAEPPARKVIGEVQGNEPPTTTEEREPAPPDAVAEYVPDPATQLTIDLAEAHGSTLRELALAADDTMQSDELVSARRALERTGLFVLTGIDRAQAVLQLRRLSPQEVLATLTARAGERLWVKAIAWPKASGPKARANDEQHYAKLQRYSREHLTLHPVVETPLGPSTIYYGGYPSPRGFADPSWGWGNGMTGGQPIPGQGTGAWLVVRGAADVIDEPGLARLVGNRQLEERIHAARMRPKIWWGVGFGLGAVAGITSGALLYSDDHHSDNTRAIGFSLLGVGVGCAIMALITPTIGNGNKLTLNETEEIISDYNRGLRESLQLSPADTQKLDGPSY